MQVLDDVAYKKSMLEKLIWIWCEQDLHPFMLAPQIAELFCA